MPSAVLIGALAFVVLGFPVVSGAAAGAQPAPAVVHEIPLSGVDRGAVSGVDRGASAGATLPGAAAVLTAPRGTPAYSAVGVTWARDDAVGALGDLDVAVRTRSHGTWSPWQTLDADSQDAPDAGSRDVTGPRARAGTAPLWTGPADGVQVRLVTASGRPPHDVRVALVEPVAVVAGRRVDRVRQAVRSAAGAVTPQQPPIVSRAQWGADESIRLKNCPDPPSYSSTVKVGFVHHTATSNTYTSTQAPAVVRSIYAYHTQSLGWCDIGYNFLVDRYGRIYEGRYGGIDKAVIGAHTGGFNTDTFGTSLIGDFSTEVPPDVMLTSLEKLFAWKLNRYGRDPHGTDTLVSAGGGTSKYPAGTTVRFDVISGHRDAGNTTCPGEQTYARLPAIRTAVQQYMGLSVTPISQHYDALGGASSFLGEPTGAETDITGGRAQTYEGGAIYYSATSGAAEVHGEILASYLSLGGPGSFLGFPTTDEQAAFNGRMSAFEGGSIFWSPGTGAHEAHGAILGHYLELGGPASFAGYPTSDEVSVIGGRASAFVGSNLYWSPATGAREVRGAIRDRYLSMGGSGSGLGIATTDEYDVPGGRQSSFQSGSIRWDAATGATAVTFS